jgi:hypothetical protein
MILRLQRIESYTKVLIAFGFIANHISKGVLTLKAKSLILYQLKNSADLVYAVFSETVNWP